MSNWSEAAEKYRRARRLEEPVDEVERAARELDEFLYNLQGFAALRLLRASQKRIIFCRTGHRGEEWFLDERGLQRTYERGCTVLTENIRAESAIKTCVQHSASRPGDLIRFLRVELDKIAAAAPGQDQRKSRQEER